MKEEASDEERKDNAANSGVERQRMMVDELEQDGVIVVGAVVVVGSVTGGPLKRDRVMVGGASRVLVGGAVAGVAAVGGNPNCEQLLSAFETSWMSQIVEKLKAKLTTTVLLLSGTMSNAVSLEDLPS